jgi:CRP-like cAMP-binding protein
MEVYFSELARTNIFAGLTETEIAGLLEKKHYRFKEYGRDEYVSHCRDECRDLLVLLKGSVRGEMSDISGKKLKIEDIPAPRALAAAFIFGKDNRYPVDIIANEPAIIMIIPKEVLVELLQQSTVLLKNYLNTISSRTQFLSDKIRFLSFKTIKEKIANYILARVGTNHHKIVLNQSQTELADFFGVTRPSLARALSEMGDDGIIHTERREITILNREKLNKLVSR